MNAKKINASDKIFILIILLPIYLFSLGLFIKLNQKPNPANIIIYTVMILLIVIGVVLTNSTKNRESYAFLILGCILAFISIFGTSLFALFVLKDVSSLALVSIILIPLFLIYLILKND